ncbi:hypothetical protein [Weissella muntiaci]|uniref:hypothetical protein n=1 Tax=Weissella muntiaci TaxID=2508881 RepID=UPI0016525D5E|nr:hypothetical protein [Weissella muntiaci]
MKTDVWDNDDKYVESVELPGLEKTDIGIDFKNDTLTSLQLSRILQMMVTRPL